MSKLQIITVIEKFLLTNPQMDYDWDELLLEYIPEMIEGTDEQSYWLTLYSMSAKTNDGHVYFDNQIQVLGTRFSERLTAVPVIFECAEGQIVVRKTIGVTIGDSFLQPGDAVISIDGVDIMDIVEDLKQYIAVPNDEKLKRVIPYLPLCMNRVPEITVLRNGEELTGTVYNTRWNYADFNDPYFASIRISHELLDNNIGLINPKLLIRDQVYSVMEEFSGTSGLIIDLRQYPGEDTTGRFAEYLLDEVRPYAVWSKPFIPVPGLFLDASISYAGPGIRVSGGNTNPYFYDKPVVILMNQQSQSACETMIMCLRTGPNVTVIGNNSIGANGNVAYLYLSASTRMGFSSLGAYTPEGGQTQRIGLSPDIYVEPTIEGIRDGRDELMEAAVAFLLGQ